MLGLANTAKRTRSGSMSSSDGERPVVKAAKKVEAETDDLFEYDDENKENIDPAIHGNPTPGLPFDGDYTSDDERDDDVSSCGSIEDNDPAETIPAVVRGEQARDRLVDVGTNPARKSNAPVLAGGNGKVILENTANVIVTISQDASGALRIQLNNKLDGALGPGTEHVQPQTFADFGIHEDDTATEPSSSASVPPSSSTVKQSASKATPKSTIKAPIPLDLSKPDSKFRPAEERRQARVGIEDQSLLVIVGYNVNTPKRQRMLYFKKYRGGIDVNWLEPEHIAAINSWRNQVFARAGVKTRCANVWAPEEDAWLELFCLWSSYKKAVAQPVAHVQVLDAFNEYFTGKIVADRGRSDSNPREDRSIKSFSAKYIRTDKKLPDFGIASQKTGRAAQPIFPIIDAEAVATFMPLRPRFSLYKNERLYEDEKAMLVEDIVKLLDSLEDGSAEYLRLVAKRDKARKEKAAANTAPKATAAHV